MIRASWFGEILCKREGNKKVERTNSILAVFVVLLILISFNISVAGSDYEYAGFARKESSAENAFQVETLDELFYMAEAGDVIVYEDPCLKGITWRSRNVHTMIVTSNNSVVEALPPKVKETTFAELIDRLINETVTKVTLLRVNVADPMHRDHAVDYAVGEKGDDYEFPVRKKNKDEHYCSQLVWQSYFFTHHYDLDFNGGLIVTPDDIYRDGDTAVVAFWKRQVLGDLFVSSLDETGTTYVAPKDGNYRFIITGGAYENCPPGSQPEHPELWGWLTGLWGYINRPISWTAPCWDEYPGPGNSDFELGDWTHYKTYREAQKAGKCKHYIDLVLNEGEFITFIVQDCKECCFWDNSGGVSLTVYYWQ